MSASLTAGAAAADITPRNPSFLFGYPHVRRISTGVHDPLLSSALYLSDGRTALLFVANDVIFVSRELARTCRERLAERLGIPPAHIMITATHTHSGPVTVDSASSAGDPAVPPADPNYLQNLEDGIVEAACLAAGRAEPATVGLALADGRGLGTNRRAPNGPTNPEVPVLAVRSADGRRHLAAMLVCSMHPTVLHEDSTLISADFPGMTRLYLQRTLLGPDCPVLHHTGPAGNQSPRHVVRAHTFDEARRIGETLGQNVAAILPLASPVPGIRLSARQALVEKLPRQSFPSIRGAQAKRRRARKRLDALRARRAPPAEIRTAECDEFGAEETLTLARAHADGRLDAFAAACLPAEVQVLSVGPWNFVGWPGEIFVEYGLAVKQAALGAFVVSLANGELQGYIVTPEAAAEGGYEASNALFAPAAGRMLVDTTLDLLRKR